MSLDELKQRQQLFEAGKYDDALDGFPGHWVYVSGNSRMSGSMCVLASGSDICNGAILNPLTWLELALLELESGWSSKADLWLASLAERVTRFPLERRRRLIQALYDLNRVQRWQPSYSLPLLTSLAPAMTMFWFEAFLTFLKDSPLWACPVPVVDQELPQGAGDRTRECAPSACRSGAGDGGGGPGAAGEGG